MKLKERIYTLLFPPKCVLCQRLLAKEETGLCRRCREETAPFQEKKHPIPHIADSLALWYYNGNVRQSLLRFKFRGKRNYAQVYGSLLALRIQQVWPEGIDLLTWVPVSDKRRKKRGYDQTQLLGEAVAAELEIPLIRTLTKIRDNPPQSSCPNHAARRANVTGVYQASDPHRFAGKRVLLLDDIITTGATAQECARVLVTANAKEVLCAAVAATPPKST